jgi:hypothetical protein
VTLIKHIYSSKYGKNAAYTQTAPTVFEEKWLEWVDRPESRLYGFLERGKTINRINDSVFLVNC